MGRYNGKIKILNILCGLKIRTKKMGLYRKFDGLTVGELYAGLKTGFLD